MESASHPGAPKRASGGLQLSSPGTSIRLMLQRRGPSSIRRHALRAFARVVLLVSADLVAFLGMRWIVRVLRDDALYGGTLAGWISAVFPRGLLGGTHFATAMIIGLALSGAYGRGDSRRDIALVAQGVSLAVALALWQPLWSGPFFMVLAQGILMLALVWAAVCAERLVFDAFIKFVFQTPADGDPMVFVGERSNDEDRRVHDLLLGPNKSRDTKWVHIPHRGSEDSISPVRALERIHDALSAYNSDTIVLCGEYEPAVLEAMVEAATSAGVRVLAMARISGIELRRAGTVWYGGAPFVELTVPGLRGWQFVVKRAMDFAGSALGLLLLSPLFALIAAAIKLDSHGPVFFSQERVGYAGRVFRVLKFRTMRQDADAMKASLAHLNASGDPRLFKIPKDPRITRLGAFLRKWSLDELPQLVNVLSGEMSLVGPRPFFESDLQTYLDHHFARLGAKPGITGLWQVKGRSSVVDFEEVVRLDREYIDRWSVALDLWILLMTVPAVLRGRGAY